MGTGAEVVGRGGGVSTRTFPSWPVCVTIVMDVGGAVADADNDASVVDDDDDDDAMMILFFSCCCVDAETSE